MLPVLISTLAIVAPAPQAKPATNTKCPVMGEKVDPKKSPKAVVRGQEYFLCCKGCAAKLEKDPDKYLEKDGTPKNAK
jgi:YHS domain-containing protein